MTSRRAPALVPWTLAAALAGCHPAGHAGTPEASAWLELPAATSSEPLRPFELEDMADAIALGRIGEPLTHQGRRWIRLDVEEVLSGPLELGSTRTPDEMPFLGCLPPPQLPRPSEAYPPGSAAFLYLQGAPGAWRILALVPRDAGDVAGSREQILLFLRASDPGAAPDLVREPLAPLPQAVYWGLSHNPSPAALDRVASHLPTLVEAICAGRTEAQPWFLDRLRLAPERAVEPLARGWTCLEPRIRASAIDHLSWPQREPRRDLAPLRHLLLDELDRDDLLLDPYLYAAVVRALGALGGPRAVERLRLELSRREGQRATQVMTALRWACKHEPGDTCAAVRRDLLELLVAAAHDPAGSDVTVVRHAVKYLVETFDGEDTRARLRGIVAAAPETWVAAEIDPYL